MVLVIGCGKSGLAVAEHFVGKQPVLAIDSRDQPPTVNALKKLSSEYTDVSVQLGSFNLADDIVQKLDFAVVSPGVDTRHQLFTQLAKYRVEVISEIECFAREVKDPVIAITGSNGKSTVTDVVYQLLKSSGKRVAIGGNFGIPAVQLLQENAEYYVLELSSFQLEATSSLRPEIGILLNVSPDHMDRYETYEDYRNAKLKLLELAQEIIINIDDDAGYEYKQKKAAVGVSRYSIQSSRKESTHIASIERLNNASHLSWNGRAIINVSELTLVGDHNYFNLLAGLSVGKLFDINDQQIKKVLTNYQGLAHRCQLVIKHQDIVWVNDSKATNVGATIAALQGISFEDNQRIILIAGGDGKGADFGPLAKAIKQYCKNLILMGKDAVKIAEALGEYHTAHVDTMEQAVALAKDLAQPGDWVVLSPACASMDMFENFEARGNSFVECIEALL